MPLLMTSDELTALLRDLMKTQTVYGPVRHGRDYVFAPLERPESVDLTYVTTVLPPKKVVRSPKETLFTFSKGEMDDSTLRQDVRNVIFGAHPCDVNALRILDSVFANAGEDPYYFHKRRNTRVVALNCSKANEHCFCTSFGSGPELNFGYDLLLSDLGETFLVEVGSDWGAAVVEGRRLREAAPRDLELKRLRMDATRRMITRRMNTSNLQRLMDGSLYHGVWTRLGSECLSCGVCNMVCPTCFCFNVKDQLNMDLESGLRYREWDSCQLYDYAEVTLGGNFRRQRSSRVRQFINHKLNYWVTQYGGYGCVGCGRCISQCIAGIDITRVVAEITGAT